MVAKMGTNTISHNDTLLSEMSVTGKRISESGLQGGLDVVPGKLLVKAPLLFACVALPQGLAVHVENFGGGDLRCPDASLLLPDA